MINTYLLDRNFLFELDNSNEKEVYIKIIALSKDETPLETIEGRSTGGSINVDGTSAVRRTCNLNLIAQDVDIHDFYWSLRNKFRLEIGLKNKINPKYPDVVWFKMGIFVITSFNASQSVNNYTINISGKDKMCLLNGDISGSLPHTTDFGKLDELDENGNRKIVKLSIKDILFYMIQEIGGELPWNIIIEDIDDFGLELLEYRGDRTLYLIKDVGSNEIVDIGKSGDQDCWIINSDGPPTKTILSKLNSYESSFNLDQTIDEVVFSDPDEEQEQKKYTVFKINYGDICGYRETELVYAGDLIGNIGDSITSILDKIKDMLGNFEYFYNIDGQFVFRKKIYLTSIKTDLNNRNNQIENILNQNISYEFMDGILINSFTNRPNISNLKNDFSVWGTYKTQAGSELPISMRYAIDKKPQAYTPIRAIATIKTLKNQSEPQITKDNDFDYIELEKKYNKSNGDKKTVEELVADEEDYSFTIIKYLLDNKKYYTKTIEVRKNIGEDIEKIEKYYIDYPLTIEDYDWRELIYQMAQDYTKEFKNNDFYYNIIEKNYIDSKNREDIFSKEIVTNFYYSTGKTGYEPYYIDIRGKWRDLYNPNPKEIISQSSYDDLIRGEELENIYIKTHFTKYEDDKNITWDILENLYVYRDDNAIYPFIDYYCKIEDKQDDSTTAQDYWYFLNATDLGPQGKTKDVSVLMDKDIRDLYIYVDDNSDIPTVIFEDIFYTYPPEGWLEEEDKNRDEIKFRTAERKSQFFHEEKNSPFYTKDNERIKTRYLPSLILASGKKMIFYENYTNYVWFMYNKMKQDKNNIFYLKDTSDEKSKIQLFSQYSDKEQLEEGHKFYKNQDELFKILKNIYWDQEKQCFNKYLPKWEKTNIFNEGNPEESKKEYVEELIDYYYGSYDYFLMNHPSQPSRKFWIKQRYNNPSQLTFWFDFLDAENSELYNVSNQVLGNRKKSLHDNNVKRVFYENIPEVIFKSSDSKIQNNLNYTVINLPTDLQSLFTISSKSKSAKEVIEELLYKHSCTLSTISITAIPVYYLEPNHKILVRDDKSNINGEYIINKISYSLNYNSLMTIEAMKFYEEF